MKPRHDAPLDAPLDALHVPPHVPGHDRASAVLAVALAAAALLGGCATVEPWDRGALLKAHMAVDPFPMRSAWRSHVENSRQAAPSGRAAEGGACGCY